MSAVKPKAVCKECVYYRHYYGGSCGGVYCCKNPRFMKPYGGKWHPIQGYEEKGSASGDPWTLNLDGNCEGFTPPPAAEGLERLPIWALMLLMVLLLAVLVWGTALLTRG